MTNKYRMPLSNRVICVKLKRKIAFSLVEMLLALLVASLLMAALAPVMTKKFNDNLNVAVSGGVMPNVFCAYSNDTTDTMFLDTEDTGCIVPDNTYSAGAIIASGGGGGGGSVNSISASSYKTLINSINTGDTDLRETVIFDKYTRDMIVKITGAGGGGGGGNGTSKIGEPEAQVDCEPFGVYISASQNGGNAICVSKYNPGENRDGSPDIPSSIAQLPAGTNRSDNTCTSAGYCCWYGGNKTSHPTATSVSGREKYNGTYDARFRTVCQWEAADTICKAWKPTGINTITGRLPNLKELDAWANNIENISFGKGDLGLQICDSRETSTLSSLCVPLLKGCPGATSNGGCYPHGIWSSTGATDKNNIKQYWNRYLDNNRFLLDDDYHTDAISVLCLVDTIYKIRPQVGGGGSSGVYAQVKVPDSVIILATENGNGKIKTYAGTPGKGGSAKSAAKGINGQRSFIEILNSNDERIWSLRVSGGNAGAGASSTLGGEAGNKVSAMCDYFDITNNDYKTEKTIECNKIPGVMFSAAGEGGISGTADTNKGLGGKSYWLGTAGDNTSPGAGGSGAKCERNDNDYTSPNCSNGSPGKGGAVSVIYKPTYPGIGGGGGSAGTVLHIKSFQVRPKDLIKVKVGEGGRGGSPAADGTNGGNSYIELANGTKYEVIGGGGGYAGITGNPNVTPAVFPKPGEPGTPSGLHSNTKNKISKNDEYYPLKNEETIGTQGVETLDMVTSAGGNGGINSKISTLADTNTGTPCGGKSITPITFKNDKDETITWQCNNTSGIPLYLSRILSTTSFDKDTLTNFAPGSTGGGGGGWDSTNASSPVSSGANGMGGYVIIYFGEWGE